MKSAMLHLESLTLCSWLLKCIITAYCIAVFCITTLYDWVAFLEVCRYPECGSTSFLLDIGSPPTKIDRTSIQITLNTLSIAVNIWNLFQRPLSWEVRSAYNENKNYKSNGTVFFEPKTLICVISGIRCKVDQNCALAGLLHSKKCNSLSTFRGELSVPSSRAPLKMGQIGCPKTSVRNHHYSLGNITEKHSSPDCIC